MTSQAQRHIKAIVGANVKAARDNKGLTQTQLAMAMGMEPMSVSRWERGIVMPAVPTLHKLAEHLGQDIGWFCTDHDKAAA